MISELVIIQLSCSSIENEVFSIFVRLVASCGNVIEWLVFQSIISGIHISDSRRCSNILIKIIPFVIRIARSFS